MFAWDEAERVRRRLRSPEARHAMYRRELEQRAELLFRLGYSQKRAKERLRMNVGWDFQLHGRPKHAADVDRIVDTVYRRGSASPGTPTV